MDGLSLISAKMKMKMKKNSGMSRVRLAGKDDAAK